jgi:glycogen debranching enzyme
MHGPWWLDVALKLRLSRVARLFRRDTKYAPEATRLSDDDGLRMLALVRRAKRHDFDLRQMPPEDSVLVEDVAFNALLAAANQSLAAIADELGTSIGDDLEQSFESTRTAFPSLWHEKSGQYYSRDRATDELIRLPTVATFLPLLAGLAPHAHTTRLRTLLRDEARVWPRYPVPSVPIDAKQFDAARYWRGPTWINTNWLIIEGLRTTGDDGTAEELRQRTLELVDRSGFAEYFSALDGEGYGAAEFSWTAALVLDLLAPS